MQTPILIIDADEMRAQRMARLLTLTGYRPYLAARPYDAFERTLQESILPQAIFLGQAEIPLHHLFQRLLQHIAHRTGKKPPFFHLPDRIPDNIPLFAHPSSASSHTLSRASIETLNPLWQLFSLNPKNFKASRHSLVLNTLSTEGLQPRISRQLQSRNSHFRQILKAAYEIIGSAPWKSMITDVGLADYRDIEIWPPDNDDRTIPPEYLSYLNQAVAFSKPEDSRGQLRLWGESATNLSMQKRTPSPLTQQVLKLLPAERVISTALNAYTEEMNEIRGEELHMWRRRPNGRYWLVHYSNLYAYGRIVSSQPACQVWEASLARVFRLLDLSDAWEVKEIECSCQTLTGHCLFVIKPR